MRKSELFPRALLVALLALLLPVLSACNSAGLPAVTIPTTPEPANASATSTTATLESTPTAPLTENPTPASDATSQGDQQVDSNAGVSGDATPVPVGSPAPDFSLPGIDGNTYSLSGQMGKVVVLEFIATWCPHCQNDAPMMNQLDAAYKVKGVQIFGINATPNGHDHTTPARTSDLRWFHDTFGVTFPLLFDKQLKSAQDYGVIFYPAIYIVDRQGNVSFQPPDDRIPNYDLLAGEIDKLIK
jgi:peroxiredoxin